MKNVCIKPFDERSRVLAEAFRIVNEFKLAGFKTRSAFVGVVQDKLPSYNDTKKLMVLWHFWQSRCIDDEVNRDLSGVLESLKVE